LGKNIVDKHRNISLYKDKTSKQEDETKNDGLEKNHAEF